MTLRANTVWCSYVPDINVNKPKVNEFFKWIFDDLKNVVNNFEHNLICIQHDPNGFYLKFKETTICQQIVEKTNGIGKIKLDSGEIVQVKLEQAGIGYKRIKILRLPYETHLNIIKDELRNYGDVISIEDEYWNNQYIPNEMKYATGTRIAVCNLKKHIPSYCIIGGYKAMIIYEGQPKTCAYCGDNNHLIATCTKKKK